MLPAQMLLLLGIVGFLSLATEACNEAVCASVVSKCQLTESCKCSLKDCTCCHECFTCLGSLYDECCSCVGKLHGPVSFYATFMSFFLQICAQNEKIPTRWALRAMLKISKTQFLTCSWVWCPSQIPWGVGELTHSRLILIHERAHCTRPSSINLLNCEQVSWYNTLNGHCQFFYCRKWTRSCSTQGHYFDQLHCRVHEPVLFLE